MKKPIPVMTKVLAPALLPFVMLASENLYAKEVVFNHVDQRATPQTIFNPVYDTQLKTNSADAAFKFIADNAERLGLKNNLSSLSLRKQKKSLTANHYYFQQSFNGTDVLAAEVIVSINLKTGMVDKVFNNSYSRSDLKSTANSKLNSSEALLNAWNNLGVTGEITSSPSSELFYVPIKGKLTLAYKVDLKVSKPFGAWSQIVDAVDGSILSVTRTDLPRKRTDMSLPKAKNKSISYDNALADFKAKLLKRNTLSKYATKADATAQVFDPNPPTTLNDDTLEDDSAANVFTSAYLSRTLLDVTLDSGVYSLVGPWVQVVDFEAPTTAPSTSNDGTWSNVRGQNAFNDVMTYFHVDQSQRYMQSLGFTGATGIQEVAITVDTDGVDGTDNSYFSSAGNQMSFGHGCVDDNEDSDVILHEYGHAINFSINSNWNGGDTGAMGEGFGDYWAGSYRYSTPNGPSFHPEWVFSWDGHNNCWNGRVMNKTSYSYDPTQSYGAHANVNGQLGDELWSTPLFQALVELMTEGESRNDVDQIILEAQFGLGASLTMPLLATATVQAAETLFPDGPHAAVFQSKFEQVDILESDNGEEGEPPVAVVANATITVNEKKSVTLNASGSLDPDGGSLSYSWAQTSGTSVTITNATSSIATFTAPSVKSDTTLTFVVTVTDEDNDTDTATVSVEVKNKKSSGGSMGWILLSLLAFRRFRK